MGEYKNYSDIGLLKLIKESSDKFAFEELYNRYWKKLLFLAEAKLNSQAEAEEVLQNVFLSLWMRRDSLELSHSFHTYISSAVKYQVFAQLGKRKNEKVFVPATEELSQQSANTTEDWLDFEESRSRIDALIQLLPEKTRQVFMLSRHNGCSQKEISEQLNISIKTVETHMTKALKILRSSFNFLLSFVVYFYS